MLGIMASFFNFMGFNGAEAPFGVGGDGSEQRELDTESISSTPIYLNSRDTSPKRLKGLVGG
ncbi:hypothetical protein GCM10007108_16060 [Thermogymnomonas acidicola]|uniref:Uncharacterized protein n=1 Tax=Thermogymnomonas acidicola TaxID=399579 RepID=A0AA37BSF9_9ARCH|nr:hypothetical protein GCM10007108_16060 [Thermogymnomonas acidicola]